MSSLSPLPLDGGVTVNVGAAPTGGRRSRRHRLGSGVDGMGGRRRARASRRGGQELEGGRRRRRRGGACVDGKDDVTGEPCTAGGQETQGGRRRRRRGGQGDANGVTAGRRRHRRGGQETAGRRRGKSLSGRLY